MGHTVDTALEVLAYKDGSNFAAELHAAGYSATTDSEVLVREARLSHEIESGYSTDSFPILFDHPHFVLGLKDGLRVEESRRG